MRTLTAIKGYCRRGGRRRSGRRVAVGDAVTVAFLPADELADRERPGSQTAEEFVLVRGIETPLDLRAISTTSGLGRALVGRGLGDIVEITTAAGRRSVRIVAVRRST